MLTRRRRRAQKVCNFRQLKAVPYPAVHEMQAELALKSEVCHECVTLLMSNISHDQDDLFRRVASIVEAARGQVARSVNTAMVHAYWLIGREIVEVEQKGEKRAEYGKELMTHLATKLTARFGRGFGVATLRRVRQFYLAYPEGSDFVDKLNGDEKRSAVLIESPEQKRSAVLTKFQDPDRRFPPNLSWSHYLTLIRVSNPQARAFYEIEAVRENWSTRELERQIASLLFDRLAKSRDKDEVLALAKEGQRVIEPRDVIKDPMVLEFLDLQEHPNWRERDLEQAIIDRLEAFLLELGKGFCFVARQKRITLEGDHFYIDLVFYNRLLKSFVLVDLKLGKLAHQDLGQMQMYVNYFDRFERQEWEQPTVGIVLCSDKNDAMVRITLGEENEQILTSRYLPTEEELRRELAREREEAERELKLQGEQ